MAAPTLVLVPTPLERAHLGLLEDAPGLRLETAGFGPVAAAARTASLVAALAPARVLLVGLAGTYDAERLPLGAATTFRRTALADLGAGRGDGFLSPADLGLPQWDDPADPAGPVHDLLPLAPGPDPADLLLTVPTASGDAAHGAERLARHGAVAEDMEAFGVALACRLAGLPLTVVRGVSNHVGDRDLGNWVAREALAAAQDLTLRLLREGATP